MPTAKRAATTAKTKTPAKKAANQNVVVMNAYLDDLHAAYSRYQTIADGKYAPAILAEFTAYKPLADAQYEQSTALGKLYGQILDVPISPCAKVAPAKENRTAAPPAAPVPAAIKTPDAPPRPVAVAPPPPLADGPTCTAALNGECKSSLPNSLVRVVRRTPDKKDPFARFGAGFFIVVFNKGDGPVSFGPGNIEVQSVKGQAYTILTVEILQARQKAAADNARTMGMLAGMSMMAMSSYGTVQGVSSSVTTQAMNTGMMAATMGENTANRIQSEAAAIDAAYTANDLETGAIAPLGGSQGRVIIDRINDRTPVVFVVHVGGDTHRIVFGGPK